MSAKQLSRKEVYYYAEQVLLGHQHWADLNYLTDDDKMRIRTVVERGVQAFAEEQTKGRYVKKQLRQSDVQPGKRRYIYVADHRPKAPLLDLISAVSIAPFPFEQISPETQPLRCRLMEHLNRHFSTEELAVMMRRIPQVVSIGLMASAPSGVQEELEQILELEDREPGVEVEALERRFSLAVVQFLRDANDVSENLREVLASYIETLNQALASYCRELPERLGLHKILDAYTDSQWNRLAGLTPRDDLALFLDILDSDFRARLVGPLPKAQSKELERFAALRLEQRQSDFEAFEPVIQGIKKWTALVNKVGREPV